MDTTARRLLIAAVPLLAIAAAAAFATAGGTRETAARTAAGIAVVCWAIVLVAYRRRRAAWPRALPAILGGAAILMAAGQISGDSAATYPLASWHMFSSVSPKHRYAYHDVHGVTEAGRAVRLVPGALFPSVGNHLLYARLHRVFQHVRRPPVQPAVAPAHAERVAAALDALVRRYDALHPEDPIAMVRLERVQLQWQAATGEHSRRRIVLLEQPVITP